MVITAAGMNIPATTIPPTPPVVTPATIPVAPAINPAIPNRIPPTTITIPCNTDPTMKDNVIISRINHRTRKKIVQINFIFIYMMENFQKIKMDYKCFKYTRYKELEIFDYILNKVKEMKLVIYGGYAMHKLILHKTQGEIGLYHDRCDIPDIDVFSEDIDGDSRKVANYLHTELNMKNIRILTGITGITRKIFVDFLPDAVLDITHKKLTVDPINIDGFLYVPHSYNKIDLYRNICINLYRDHYRFYKVLKRVQMYEYYFPINVKFPSTPLPMKFYEFDIKTVKGLCKEIGNEFILGGDMIYNYYYNSVKISNLLHDCMILSNELKNKYTGLICAKNMIFFPIFNETIYNEVNGIKIMTRSTLCFYYYMLRTTYHTAIFDDKLSRLIADPKTFNYYKKMKIFVPKTRYELKIKRMQLPTIHL